MVHINPQVSWETGARPITGPGPQGVPGQWVIHYPGSTSLYEPMSDTEMIKYLRSMQRGYLDHRGYSLGYSVICSQSGSLWAARGLEGYPGVRVYNPASNPGKKLASNQNNVTRSIQIAVGGQNEASPAAVAAVNALIATQPDWGVIVHSDIDWTRCAGEGVTRQVRSGIIGHQSEPIITPPEKDEDMNPITPFRNSDSRYYGVKMPAGDHVFDLDASRLPKDAKAVAINVAVLNSDKSGFITVWPGDERPAVSMCNFTPGAVANGSTVVGCEDLKISVHTSAACDFVLDVTAYWV